MGHLRLSRAAFKHADLGLNHYQKKGAPLDRKMERQSVRKWVGGERERHEVERRTRGGGGCIQKEPGQSRRKAGDEGR